MTSERRRSPRVSLEVDVGLTTEDNFFAATTRDVSAGGLFIACPIGLEHGTAVKVKLALGKKTHELTTRVAWVLNDDDGKPVGFGVEFEGLSAAAARAIATFVTKRDPMAFGIVSAHDDDDEDVAEASTEPPSASPPPLPKS